MLRLLPIFLTATIALSAPVALAAPADVDRGFGRDGRAIIDFGGEDDYAFGIAAQPDGKLVTVGATSLKYDAVAARVNPDGSPDLGFGVAGVAALESDGTDSAHAVAIQPDGKIVVVGRTSTGDNGIVYRLNADGSPDRGFGTEGAALVDSGGYEALFGVAIQPDGKIVVAGHTSVGKDLAVYRLTAQGKPDNSFDEDGARGIDAGGEEAALGVALQPDGKIVVAGYTLDSKMRPLVARFRTNGVPDPTFGPEGWRALVNLGILYGVAVQPDGRIVAAGEASASSDAGVYRLDSNGELDETFGEYGTVLLDSGGVERATALALQPDGKIVVAGGTEAGYDGVVWRLGGDGSRDQGFGDEGELVVGGTGLQYFAGVALQPDGKIALSGTRDANDNDGLIYRLLGDSTQPQPGGGGGAPAKVVRCGGLKATIVGTARRDVIRGTRRRDVIAALGGNDVVRGRAGNDVICGGGGRDRLLGGAGRDRLIGGPGRDRLIGGPGRDQTR